MSPSDKPALASRRRPTVVAMSGGVDSSVAAAMLKREGHDVIGVTLQLYDSGAASGRKGSCCAGQDIHDARRVADALGIPHFVLDYEARFRDAVIAPFAESYIAGETPIPCVSCNQTIKFRDLLETAGELGAASLVTGHYIQKREGAAGPIMLRAADRERDQSYFLFATTRTQLERLAFPLGGMQKPEVRALARDWGLPVAEKPDSQDICFVPKGHYTGIIERLKPGALASGDIVHADGRVLGRHHGIVNFTIGQRRGLGIAGGEPLFVLGLDAAQNRVIVGPRDLLRTKGLVLRNVNWLGDDPIDAEGECRRIVARVRSTGGIQPATLRIAGGRVSVLLDEGEFGVARGQACVFYESAAPQARVLGGGWIEETIRAHPARVAMGGAAMDTAATRP